jgi:hypothetical protein
MAAPATNSQPRASGASRLACPSLELGRSPTRSSIGTLIGTDILDLERFRSLVRIHNGDTRLEPYVLL